MKEFPKSTTQFTEPNIEHHDFFVTMGKIKHVVEAVNPQFTHELPYKKGDKDTPFGYFACTKKEGDNACVPQFTLGVLPGHNRSVIWGQFDFRSKDGRLFRDLDIKGSGHTSLEDYLKYQHLSDEPLFPLDSGIAIAPHTISKDYNPLTHPDRYWGLMSLREARHDMEVGRRLASFGVRVVEGVMILRLNELFIPDQGLQPLKTFLKTAKRREGLLHHSLRMIPVNYVRAYGVRSRVNEFPLEHESALGAAWLERKRQEVVIDAIHFVEREIGVKEGSLSVEDYFRWFAKALGRNVGLMHAHGFTAEGCISNSKAGSRRADDPCNITLDARLVDLESVRSLPLDQRERSRFIADDQSDASLILTLLLPMYKEIDPRGDEAGWLTQFREELHTLMIAAALDAYSEAKTFAVTGPLEIGYMDSSTWGMIPDRRS